VSTPTEQAAAVDLTVEQIDTNKGTRWWIKDRHGLVAVAGPTYASQDEAQAAVPLVRAALACRFAAHAVRNAAGMLTGPYSDDDDVQALRDAMTVWGEARAVLQDEELAETLRYLAAGATSEEARP
jgi:hypothetical protein